jgi:hypothetical protein
MNVLDHYVDNCVFCDRILPKNENKHMASCHRADHEFSFVKNRKMKISSFDDPFVVIDGWCLIVYRNQMEISITSSEHGNDFSLCVREMMNGEILINYRLPINSSVDLKTQFLSQFNALIELANKSAVFL